MRLPLFLTLVTLAAALDTEVKDPLAQAALAFLAELPPEQRSAATFPFDAGERLHWQPVPFGEAGVRLSALDDEAREKLWSLLGTALSPAGVETVRAVMRAETALVAREAAAGNPSGWHGAERFFTTIYGDPAGKAPWALRFEGHHLSISVTHQNETWTEIAPFFVGSQPARLLEAEGGPLRVTGKEDDLARALWQSLDEEQQQAATLRGAQPGNVILVPGVDELDERGGIAAADLDKDQQATLRALLEVWTERLGEQARASRALILRGDALLRLRFGWMGSSEQDGAHYWRVFDDELGIEYSAQAADPDHVHTIWRDRGADLGAARLRAAAR